MADSSHGARFAARLTSRRGAWIALGIAVVVMAALFGVFAGATAPARSGQAPPDSESARVDELVQRFPDADRGTVLVVATRHDQREFTREDRVRLRALLPVLESHGAGEAAGPVVSDDGRAAVLTTAILTSGGDDDTAEAVKALRSAIAENRPEGMALQVTGGPAFGVDVAAAFDGADVTLLAVTVLIVAVLLIGTYRSPVLWLIPLVVIALADGLAGRVTAAAGAQWNLSFDGGIVSVLVFGAGTNYALLLISRYRDELHTTDDDRAALCVAWRRTVPAVLASNVTVVLALLSLLFAAIPMTRGLGIPAAIGLVIALAAVLLVLPPVLAVCGRRAFWPFIPRPGRGRAGGRVWRAVASRVTRRASASLVAGLALLAVMAAGLVGTSLGLEQLDRFRVPSESAAGLRVLSAHFPPGEAQPIVIVTDSAATRRVVAAASRVEAVVRAHPAGTTAAGDLTKIVVTSAAAPGSQPSIEQIARLREAVHPIAGAHALVGGAVATELDARAGNERDLLVIAPLVLGVSFVVLAILLRSLVAPLLLLPVNLASAVAAIGAGAGLSRLVFDQPALDPQVPILAFLFLVALGIDYTIFLVHRARTEAGRVDTRAAMVEAVAHTGAVITSAGIVLAGVFAALGVLPLVVLGQLGLIVSVGVLVDTLVVRTVIVPAIFGLVGDRLWWPGTVTTGGT